MKMILSIFLLTMSFFISTISFSHESVKEEQSAEIQKKETDQNLEKKRTILFGLAKFTGAFAGVAIFAICSAPLINNVFILLGAITMGALSGKAVGKKIANRYFSKNPLKKEEVFSVASAAMKD